MPKCIDCIHVTLGCCGGLKTEYCQKSKGIFKKRLIGCAVMRLSPDSISKFFWPDELHDIPNDRLCLPEGRFFREILRIVK